MSALATTPATTRRFAAYPAGAKKPKPVAMVTISELVPELDAFDACALSAAEHAHDHRIALVVAYEEWQGEQRTVYHEREHVTPRGQSIPMPDPAPVEIAPPATPTPDQLQRTARVAELQAIVQADATTDAQLLARRAARAELSKLTKAPRKKRGG